MLSNTNELNSLIKKVVMIFSQDLLLLLVLPLLRVRAN